MRHPTKQEFVRHLTAGILLIISSYPLSSWYRYQHSDDLLLFLAAWLSGILLAGGHLFFLAFRKLQLSRKFILILLILIAVPWGEWLKLNPAAKEDWLRQLYSQTLWIYGTLLCFGLFPGIPAKLSEWFRRFIFALSTRSEIRWILPVLFFALAAYGAIKIYGQIPVVGDSASYIFQARIFAAGHLSAPQPAKPEFFDVIGDHVVMTNGRWFTMYQPGFSALLAPFLQLKSEWLVSPALAALTLILWIAYAKRWYALPVAVLTGFFLLFSPFFRAMSSALMSHPLEMFLATGILFLCRRDSEDSSPWRSLLLFVLVFSAIISRGFSLIVFLWPVFAYSLVLAVRRRNAILPSALFLGLIAGLAALAFFQWKTTGDPRTPGYNFEYDIPHRYGFGPAPLGQTHTPLRGLENVSNNLLGLNIWATGWPSGTLFFIFLFLFFAPRLDPWDRVLCIGSGSLLLFYYFYFFQDLAYGPRYLYFLCPLVMLAIARLLNGAVSGTNKSPVWIPALVIVMFIAYLPNFWVRVNQGNPSRYPAAGLKKEIEKYSGQKMLVFIDRHCGWHLVNWNDPFLQKNVILCRDLGSPKNLEAMEAFPDHRPVYFRNATSMTLNKLQSGYAFYPDQENNPPGYLSLFGLAVALSSSNLHIDFDCFDVTYSDLFVADRAGEQMEYLNSLEKNEAVSTLYRRDFKQGLVHAARMLLLPKVAFERREFQWSNGFPYGEFRRELESSKQFLASAGPVGQPILEALDKAIRRMDTNEDSQLSDDEIKDFLSPKVYIFALHRPRYQIVQNVNKSRNK
jgi:hypothetical protein